MKQINPKAYKQYLDLYSQCNIEKKNIFVVICTENSQKNTEQSVNDIFMILESIKGNGKQDSEKEQLFIYLLFYTKCRHGMKMIAKNIYLKYE